VKPAPKIIEGCKQSVASNEIEKPSAELFVDEIEGMGI